MKSGMNKTWENGVMFGVELKHGRTGWLGSVLVVTSILVILVLASTAQAEEMTPGSVFHDCEQCPEMVVVSAERSPTPFAVGKYEVTRGEFARFVQGTGHSTGNTCRVLYKESDGFWTFEKRAGFGWRNPGFSQTDRHPVTCVNWHDAQAYVQWLSRQTGKTYRLLREAEWEAVVGAGGGAWHAENSGKGTYPVGQKAPNGLGLYDMLGNAGEWVEGCWEEEDDWEGGAVSGK